VRRYEVLKPVPGGDDWKVIDTTPPLMVPVAWFAVGMPNAEPEAHALCYRLNTLDPTKACQ